MPGQPHAMPTLLPPAHTHIARRCLRVGVTQVRLGHNLLGDDGAVALCRALKESRVPAHSLTCTY